MKEKFENILNENVIGPPKQVPLNLSNFSKETLPKLKKVEI